MTGSGARGQTAQVKTIMSSPPKTPDASSDEKSAKLAELIAVTRVCMFTTVDADSRMMSRPMAVQEVEFDGDLWISTNCGGRKVEQIEREPRAYVALSSGSSWVSVTGSAEVVDDVAKAREPWNAGISGWFPDAPADPDIVLVKVHTHGGVLGQPRCRRRIDAFLRKSEFHG